MLLALFLIDLAAGLYLFLPLVGRRNAGVKFYRLIFIVSGVLMVCASIAHWAIEDLIVIALTIIVYATLRYPKRLIFRVPSALLGAAYIAVAIYAWRITTTASWIWSTLGALASIALLGSVNLAMLLGHWYLVVRGMSIDPLKRLTMATLVSAIARTIVVIMALLVPGMWSGIAIRQGIFFWMRAGWGLIAPLALYPMVRGTVKIRSTMSATGILYVVVIFGYLGELTSLLLLEKTGFVL